MSRNRRAVALLAGAWIAGAAGFAVAQDRPSQPAPPPLQGPKVTPNRPKELEDEFAPGKRDQKGAREPGIRMPVYLEIIGKLRAEETPAELRLTDEQDRKIKASSEEFRTAMREFAQKNNLGNGDRPGRRNPQGKGGAAGEEMSEEQRARMEELRRSAPKPVDAQAKIWNVLSAPQQKFVKGELDKARAEVEKKRGEEYMRREVEKRRAKDGKDGASPTPPPPPTAPQAGRPPAPGEGGPPPEVRERVQRIFEKLRQLSPEERERVLRRLEEDLDRHAADMQDRPEPPPPKKPAGGKSRDGFRPARPGDEAPPPPSMDDVKVPPARPPG